MLLITVTLGSLTFFFVLGAAWFSISFLAPNFCGEHRFAARLPRSERFAIDLSTETRPSSNGANESMIDIRTLP